MSWFALARQRLRDARFSTAAMIVFSLVTCFVFAGAPRFLALQADAALRAATSAARVDVRGISIVREGRISAVADPLALVTSTGSDIRSTIPDDVRALLSDVPFVVDSPRWLLPSDRVNGATLRLRFQPGAERALRLVSGRLPTGRVGSIRAADGVTLPVLEIALSSASARKLLLDTGGSAILTADASDHLVAQRSDRIGVRVVGVFDVPDPDAPSWFADASLARPNTRPLSPSFSVDDATALVSSDAYGTYLRATAADALPLRYTWRYSVVPDRLAAERLPVIDADVRRMEALFPASTVAAPGGPGALQTGLLRVLTAEEAAWSGVSAALSVVMVGAGAVAALALVLVAALVGTRRRPSVALWRDRGASPEILVAAELGENLIVLAPAALAGAVAAIVAIPSGDPVRSVALALGVGLAAAVVLTVASMPRAARSAGRAAGRGQGPAEDAGRRRAVAETFAVGLALLGAVLLRSRGIAAGSPGATGIAGAGADGSGAATVAGHDPFIAMVPALVGLAAGIVALRAFPFLLRALSAVAARRRDLVPLLALRRAARGGAGASVLVVLLAITTIAAFSSAIALHVDGAVRAAAWQDVGAAYRLSSPGQVLPASLDPRALPGVQAVAAAHLTPLAVGTTGTPLMLVALDARAYSGVVAGTPAADGSAVPLLESGDGDIPVIVSSLLSTPPNRLAPGDTFALVSRPETFRVVAVRDAFPSVPVGQAFVVVPRDRLAVSVDPSIGFASELFLRAQPSAAGPLANAAARSAPAAVLLDAAAEARSLGSSPYVAAVVAGSLAAMLVAALYAALAIAASFALAGSARAIELAHLRTLGVTRRQSVGLIVVEQVPAVVVGFAAGALLGAALFSFLEPGLGLAAMVGRQVAVPLRVDGLQLAALLVVLTGIVALGVALEAALERRVALVAALRRGIE